LTATTQVGSSPTLVAAYHGNPHSGASAPPAAMFDQCRRCGGTRYLGRGGRSDDADICCDGGTWTCDACGDEIDSDDLEDTGEDARHLCLTCKAEEEDEEQEQQE
jgi:hypothetical protein